MSSPQASSNEKENEGGLLSPMRPASKQPIVEASVEGQDELPEEAVTGKWRGHLGSLFSPMLRIFGDGGDEVAEAANDEDANERERLAEQARIAQEAERVA